MQFTPYDKSLFNRECDIGLRPLLCQTWNYANKRLRRQGPFALVPVVEVATALVEEQSWTATTSGRRPVTNLLKILVDESEVAVGVVVEQDVSVAGLYERMKSRQAGHVQNEVAMLRSRRRQMGKQFVAISDSGSDELDCEIVCSADVEEAQIRRDCKAGKTGYEAGSGILSYADPCSLGNTADGHQVLRLTADRIDAAYRLPHLND